MAKKKTENIAPEVSEEIANAKVVEEAIAEVAPVVENTEATPVDNVALENVEPSLTTQSLGSTEGLSEAVMQKMNVDRVAKRQKAVKIIVKVFVYLFLSIMALIVVFPFYWMIISSLKQYEEYNSVKPTFWPTQGLDFANYLQAFELGNLGTLFLNTLYVGVISTILSLVITVLSAFAFARLQFKGKNILFAILLATMMIPGELFTITNYRTISSLGWNDSYIVLIVPFLVSVFYIYLLRQNFMQIPDELYYAAKVDGTSDLKYLWKVMIPLAMPTLISITILKMMGSWNTYIWPSLVNTSDVYQLVTVGIRNMEFTDPNSGYQATRPDYPVQMAAVTVVSIPLFLVFIFLRKYIMKGVSRSGIKG